MVQYRTMKIDTYTTGQASRIAGFRSPMMVEYLRRCGVVRPSIRDNCGRGVRVLYGFGDLILLRAVQRLLESGVQVSKIKEALNTQRKQFRDLGPREEILKYLITDGKSILLRNNAQSIIELNKKGQFAFAFIVDLHEAKSHILKEIPKHERKYSDFPKSIRKKRADTQ